ncbi:GntR family transcriptional regulator [Terrihabitans soli]|uniref:GntR family transcriptional regulator n=1 Tax=Terrihabitans soli TaxID=708113 RepID=A0A6S6QK33_9HYPH|nr:GntR family transcriptional regulator [Terrihabitans soli]BCJ89596.1 GntR family transcriptional regulator [Terrihabitans soli]
MAPQKTVQAPDEKPVSLAALAYQKLHADITSGQLAPGQKLLVADLNERYGIGLSPLRDALNRLCADGLAVKREQKGFFVAALDEAAFLEITNARLVMEEAALRLSIANGDTAWEESVVLAFYRLAKVASGGGTFMLTPEWSAAHQDFHTVLWAACENEWLLGFCNKLFEQTTRYRARRRLLFADSPLHRENVVQGHKDIMEACIARDADLAGDLLVNHYKDSFEFVMGIECKLLDNPRRLVPLPGAVSDKAKAKTVGTV